MKPEDLRNLRHSLALSAAEAARIAGLKHPQSWQRYENGARALPRSTAELFALRTGGLEILMKAARFAAVHHDGQHRKGADRAPYIVHPMSVAIKLVEVFVTDPEVIAAAILHDTIENCGVTREEIAEEFGDRVASIVAEVSDDPKLSRPEQLAARLKKAPGLSIGAATVKLADILINLEDLANDPPVHWDAGDILFRVTNYLALADALPPVNRRLLNAVRDLGGSLL